jgi:sugar lactone lactonase YvrE
MTRRFTLALLGAALVVLGAAASAFAAAHQEAVYCGDPVDQPTCTAATNFDFVSQGSIVVEHSLTATGQFVWAGHKYYSKGWVAGENPIAGAGNSGVDHQINTNYTDPAGDLGFHLDSLDFDPVSNTLFIADSDANRVVAYSRGTFSGNYPVDYSRGGQVGGMAKPLGLAYNAFSQQLVVADTDNNRLNLYDFAPATFAGSPPAGGPTLTYDQSFGSADWSDDGTKPLDVATDPTNGHIFVALNVQDTVQEYDSTGNLIQTYSTGLTGPNGVSKALAIDPDARLLYIAKAGTIEVVSISTGQNLGVLLTGFEQSDGASIVDIDVDPIAHTLYMVTSQAAAADNTEAPVTGLQLDPPPACNLQPVKVLPGASAQIRPSCSDIDGGLIEYSVVGPASAGSASNIPDRSALSYVAPATVGSATIPFRARSRNGRTTTFNQPVTIADDTPVVRKTANLSLDSGVVLIKLPGSDKFVPLTEDTLIPMGTVIDASKGKAHLTFANADGSTQDGIFWEGIFQVSQGSGDKPITILKLRDDLAKAASASSVPLGTAASVAGGFQAWTARKRGKKKNGLWGDAHGKFKTSGKGGSAAVRGTRWYVADYKCGALFKTARGKVLVDPVIGKNFFLTAGKQKFIFYKKCLR